jgi:hypothetical protein
MGRSIRPLQPLALVAALAVLLGGARAGAQLRNRTHRDGTVEFTNRGSARADRQRASASASSSGGASASAGRGASTGGTFWARERADGVVEFTNVKPAAGASWKVWLKTGPGKAGALRGRTDVVPPRDGSPARYARYDQHIHDQQVFYGIPQAFVRAVIKVESDFDPNVVSSVGAQGLMQLMPGTARLMGVTDSFDARQNIMGGSRYLQVLARRFCRTPVADEGGAGAATAAAREGGPDLRGGRGGDQRDERALVCSDEEIIKVIAGYHAGPGAVEKYGGMPPYETTRAYVNMVLRRYEEYRLGPAAHAGAFLSER